MTTIGDQCDAEGEVQTTFSPTAVGRRENSYPCCFRAVFTARKKKAYFVIGGFRDGGVAMLICCLSLRAEMR